MLGLDAYEVLSIKDESDVVSVVLGIENPPEAFVAKVVLAEAVSAEEDATVVASS